MDKRYVVKVAVSGGQARVTIPKDLAVKRKLLSENGEAGEATYVSATKGDGGRIVLHPLRLEELTEDE